MFHLHKWEISTIEDVTGYKNNHRVCKICKQEQVLDVDGWCYYADVSENYSWKDAFLGKAQHAHKTIK